MTTVHIAHSTAASDADLDTVAPNSTTLGTYLDHNKVFNGLDYGCVADGDVDAGTGTDNTTALQAIITESVNTGRAAFLPKGVYRYSTTQLTATGGFTLIGEPGTVLFKDHTHHGLYIASPTALVTSTITAQSDNSKAQVAGAAFTVDAYAGHYCEITTDDSGSIARSQRRKILSNTADTLTLEYDLALTPADGDAVVIYDIISGITIENVTIQSNGAGQAGIDFSFVDDVRLTNVRSIDHDGNGISINTGRNIRLENCRSEDNATFGIFVYNCDDAILTNCVGVNVGGSYHLQLKDCRNSALVGCYAEGGADNDTASNGINVKGSGLNPAYNVRVVGASVFDIPGIGLQVLGSHEEAAGGTPYEFQNVSVSGTVYGNGGTSTGVEFINELSGAMQNARGHALTVLGTKVGLSLKADDVAVTDFSIAQCTSGSVSGVSVARVKLANGVLKDGCMSGTAGNEMGLSSCTDWTVTNVSAVHTTTSSASDGFVLETSTADRNLYIDCRVLDTASTKYSRHYLLVGTSSQVVHTARKHQSVTYAATVTPDCALGEIVDIGTLTGNITVAAPTHPLRGLRLTLNFTEDATGGRTITLNSVFKATWTPVTTASKRNTITFEYDGTNWIQQYATVGF